MFQMIDRIIFNSIVTAAKRSQVYTAISPLSPDMYESPRSYHRWVFFIRFICAIRYISLKKQSLAWLKTTGPFPPKRDVFVLNLINRLRPDSIPIEGITEIRQLALSKGPRFALLFQAHVFYPLLFLLLSSTGVFIHHRMNEIRILHTLAYSVPEYCDLIHLKKEKRAALAMFNTMGKFNDSIQVPDTSVSVDYLYKAEKQNQMIDSLHRAALSLLQKAMTNLPVKHSCRQRFSDALHSLLEESISDTAIITHFTKLNMALEKSGLPYYLTPKIIIAEGVTYLPTNFQAVIEQLPSFIQRRIVPYKERSIMVLPYEVSKRVLLAHEENHYPVYFCTRIDNLLLSESAFGLTYHHGLGAQIFQDRISSFIVENIMPAVIQSGHSLLFPYFETIKTDVLEKVAANAIKKSIGYVFPHDSARVVTGFKKYVNLKMRQKEFAALSKLKRSYTKVDHFRPSSKKENWFDHGLDVIVHLITDSLTRQGDNAPGLPKEIVEIEQRFMDAVAFHEVQHQINEKLFKKDLHLHDSTSILSLLNDDDDKVLKKILVDEVSAYLVGLYYAHDIRHIILTDILAIALNAVSENEPEFFATRYIINALKNARDGMQIVASWDDRNLVENYKRLCAESDERLGQYTQKAYEGLFKDSLPQITFVN
ncbi:MAG: hypothetical protein PVI26_00250 [Chitinispirillia bacterium]|jgi:hypothetical protein